MIPEMTIPTYFALATVVIRVALDFAVIEERGPFVCFLLQAISIVEIAELLFMELCVLIESGLSEPDEVTIQSTAGGMDNGTESVTTVVVVVQIKLADNTIADAHKTVPEGP